MGAQLDPCSPLVPTQAHYQHPNSLCESEKIGVGTRIWAFTHILPNATIGSECNICDHVFVENDVIIGNRVTVKSGVQLWDGVRLEDNVFVGPNVTFTNDPFPRSKQYPKKFPTTNVKVGASIGANATILPGITIGSNAMIGAGAVVTRNVPANAKVVGNPARIVGYMGSKSSPTGTKGLTRNQKERIESTGVGQVTLHYFPNIRDMRGSLTVGEFGDKVPFSPQRYFLVYGVPNSRVRGEHAHKECEQFLICTHGECSVAVDDGKNREEFRLDSPNMGVYLPAMTWAVQYKYTANAVLLVFASHAYDASDYIRDYEQFLRDSRVSN